MLNSSSIIQLENTSRKKAPLYEQIRQQLRKTINTGSLKVGDRLPSIEGSTIGFADGHAERIKWKDPDTIALVDEGILDPDPANNEDLRWLAKGYIPMP